MSEKNQAPTVQGWSDGQHFIPTPDGKQPEHTKGNPLWRPYSKQAGQEPDIDAPKKVKAEKHEEKEKEDNHKGHKR